MCGGAGEGGSAAVGLGGASSLARRPGACQYLHPLLACQPGRLRAQPALAVVTELLPRRIAGRIAAHWQDEMGEHAVTAVVATWPGEDGQPEVHFEVSTEHVIS